MHRTLLVVDVQNDFCQAARSLFRMAMRFWLRCASS